jgi:hypothetical protein
MIPGTIGQVIPACRQSFKKVPVSKNQNSDAGANVVCKVVNRERISLKQLVILCGFVGKL